MADDRIDPAAEIPEADLLEQQAPLSSSDTEIGPPTRDAANDPVDEADRWEQEAPVPGDDDDYPHEPSGAG